MEKIPDTQNTIYDVIVIGAGICGAAAAFMLSKYSCNVLVIEKENDIACRTTKANSGIVHAGYDPLPGTIMARTNVDGNRWIRENAKTLSLSFRQTGSLVVAFTENEEKTVCELYERGIQNGVEALSVISGDEARLLEPSLSGEVRSALYSKTAGVISPWDFALKLMQNAVHNGVTLIRDTAVEKLSRINPSEQSSPYTVKTSRGEFFSRFIINAAGLEAESVWSMLPSSVPPFKTKPSKGEYYLLDKTQTGIVKSVIFQCPNENGKGVLVAQTSHGNVLVGPSAMSSDKDDTSTTLSGLSFVREAATKSVPSLTLRDNIRNFAGVRAAGDREDFVFEEDSQNPGVIHMAGIKSPGLTAAPALALEAVELLKKRGLKLCEKQDFSILSPPIKMTELSLPERIRLIEKSPLYGRIICRCEKITEGEIEAALAAPVPPVSIDGVKRRCGTGMGRCQGGFCSPRVHEILSRRLNIPMDEIPMDRAGTFLLCSRTKKPINSDETKKGGVSQ